MPWVKLDDQFPDHPKVISAGGDAAWLYVAGLCYCQAKLTDGHIPAGMVARLTDRKNAPRLAEKLVEVRLWEVIEGGYFVHDYGEHNLTAEKVKAKRKATKDRVTAWREKRECNAVTDDVTNAVTNDVGNAGVTSPANRYPLTASEGRTKKQASPSAPRLNFDFMPALARFPQRSKGATPIDDAVKACKKKILTLPAFEAFEASVDRYAQERAGEDPAYHRKFSNWLKEQDFSKAAQPSLAIVPAAPTRAAYELARNPLAGVERATSRPDVSALIAATAAKVGK